MKPKNKSNQGARKKAMVESSTAMWILALLVLVVLFLILFFLKGKGVGFIDRIFDILRFGR